MAINPAGGERPAGPRSLLGTLTTSSVALMLLIWAAFAPRGAPALAAGEGPASKKWTIVPDGPPVPPLGQQSHVHISGLGSIAVVSKQDAWAVGVSADPSNGVDHPAAEHWNGQYWSYVPTPAPSSYSWFRAVRAFSAQDAWAVGSYFVDDGSHRSQTLAEHWDGRAWTPVPTANPAGRMFFFGLDGVATDDLWAVGTRKAGSTWRTLVEHWDGTIWKVMPSPNLLSGYAANEFWAVEAITPKDVWAVGRAYTTGGPVERRGLIEHWDGKAWKVIPSRNPGYDGWFRDISAVSPTDVWAVGEYEAGGKLLALVEHWDGARWSLIPVGKPESSLRSLYGVLGISAHEVWAVGAFRNGVVQTLTERWDGERWKWVPSPNLPTTNGGGEGFESVAAIPEGGGLWAVGDFYNENAPSNALIERYGVPWCFDGIDNDHDGTVDYPDDPGCTAKDDGSEIGIKRCDDGADNDADGRIDYRVDGTGDGDCLSPSGDTELIPAGLGRPAGRGAPGG